ncbi:MAG: hypothetical protein CMF99_09805 [Candidatus Marinimicrobia bacterium]|nr:hypothetical protein [Candidatus Neomarinimicrobiota bacterium]|tara:strand:+ start:1093 stop:1635 length:543 start_codon:yes stop_codon:yes gene_type:complete
MRISLKIKLLFYWHKIFKSNRVKDSTIKISKKGKGVKSVVFLLPNERKQAQLAAHFIKHDDKKNKFHFNYILDENSLHYYDKKIIPNAHVIKKDHINWLGVIISKKTIKKINDLGFDAIVDLNQSHNQNLSFILKDLKIPIKVGFQAEFSNFLYSIIIESKSIGFVEDNYKTIEKILGLE